MRLNGKTNAMGVASVLLVLLATWLIGAVARHKDVTSANSPPDPLADLEMRISRLEKVGPFEVVDKQEKPIFIVDWEGGNLATVLNSNGALVAILGADKEGGYLQATSADGSKSSSLGFRRGSDSLSFYERIAETVSGQNETRSECRLALGPQEAGNYSLDIFGRSGTLIAGIGESKAGSGAIVVGDQKVNRASMIVGENGKGIIGIFNGDGKAIAKFGEAIGNTGGSLVLGDAKGEPMVKMGTNENRYGVVIALPQGLPYVPKSGLPGSYLLGCGGGPSCVR